MGMGHMACTANIIEKEDILKVIPDEFQALEDLLEVYQVTWDELAAAEEYGDTIDEAEEGAAEEIHECWVKAAKVFEEKTGLELFIGLHNQEDEGSRYDDVDGVYFSLGNVFRYTPEAKKLMDNGIAIEQKFWVRIG